MKLVHACLGGRKGIEINFTTVEVLRNSCLHVCVSVGTLKAIFTTVEVL